MVRRAEGVSQLLGPEYLYIYHHWMDNIVAADVAVVTVAIVVAVGGAVRTNAVMIVVSMDAAAVEGVAEAVVGARIAVETIVSMDIVGLVLMSVAVVVIV